MDWRKLHEGEINSLLLTVFSDDWIKDVDVDERSITRWENKFIQTSWMKSTWNLEVKEVMLKRNLRDCGRKINIQITGGRAKLAWWNVIISQKKKFIEQLSMFRVPRERFWMGELFNWLFSVNDNNLNYDKLLIHFSF